MSRLSAINTERNDWLGATRRVARSFPVYCAAMRSLSVFWTTSFAGLASIVISDAQRRSE